MLLHQKFARLEQRRCRLALAASIAAVDFDRCWESDRSGAEQSWVQYHWVQNHWVQNHWAEHCPGLHYFGQPRSVDWLEMSLVHQAVAQVPLPPAATVAAVLASLLVGPG